MSAMAPSEHFVVLKFGGTSVSTKARWDTITEVGLKRKSEGRRPVIVCSALSGISNLLEGLVASAPRGEYEAVCDQIVERHRDLANTLGINADEALAGFFAELRQIARGAALLREASPRTHARLMALGELMSTTLGAAYMQSLGHRVQWLDARHWLRAAPHESISERRHFLSSACDYAPDPAMQLHLSELGADIYLTQGFIARDDDGETVLLGRGGSDTSAAYFAAKLQAERCEIWTDVPGMFTADPRLVPVARHLRAVNYDEAQEIATTGGKVLHPRCIAPCRENNIPIEIRSTPDPRLEGTTIGPADDDQHNGVKALSLKKDVVMITMDSVGMWQQVGFLADIFAAFKAHGLSVDQVSTSETNVTVTLDPTANTLTDEVLESLERSLRPHCKARIIRDVTALSMVGTGIRAILHRLGPAFSLFEDPNIYLVSQAASDLNFTFVLDSERAPRLIKKLHEELFDNVREGEIFGRTWEELVGEAEDETTPARWWERRRADLLGIDVSDAPAYVYDAASISGAAASLAALQNVNRVFYAMKANSNDEVLRLIEAEGIGFECVSPGELERVFSLFADLDPQRVLFTPNFASVAEYAAAFERGVHVNLDNLHPLQHHPQIFAGREVCIRVDPGEGKGHHDHVRTGGRGSKFGIDREDLDELIALATANDVRIVGLHMHAGSGILQPGHWRETAERLLGVAERFQGLRYLDLGGGLGVVERPDQRALNLAALDESLAEVRALRPDLELWLEPGRYFVAEAGVLLAPVTQMKGKGEVRYVGTSAGMHSLLRPALYGAYHRIVNLSRLGEPAAIHANIVGPICESGDTLGFNRWLPETYEGDIMLVDTAGAYGFTMSSEYNLRGLPQEIVLRA